MKAPSPSNAFFIGSYFILFFRLFRFRSAIYIEVLFAFANANLHDNGVIVFAHVVDLEVLRLIHNLAHTENFYVAKNWFGMSDLDLQFPSNPSELVLLLGMHLFSFIPSI